MSSASVSLILQILRQRRRLTATRLAGCLSAHGYAISGAEYTAFESGATMPRDARAFLHALTTCLNLTHDELEVLLNIWALTVLTEAMGQELARQSLQTLIPV